MCKFFKIFLFTLFLFIAGSFFAVPKSHAAYLNITGFETGDTSEIYSSSGSISVSTAQKRTGTYSFKAGPGAAAYARIAGLATDGTAAALGKTTQTWGSFYFYPTTGASNYFAKIGSTGMGMTIGLLLSSGNVYLSGTEGAYPNAGAVTFNAWNLLEFRATKNGTSAIKLNGGAEVTQTGYNATIDVLQLGDDVNDLGGSGVYFDDVAISDSAYPGAGQVNIIKPTGITTQTWSDGAGSTPTNVSEVPNDGITSYVYSHDTNYDRNIYSHTTSAAAGINGNVAAVKTVGITNTTGAGSAPYLYVGLSHTSDTYQSTPAPTSASWAPVQFIVEKDPADGTTPLSTSILDSSGLLILAYEGSGFAQINVTSVYGMVWNSPAAPTITSPTKTPIHGSDATLGGNVTSDGGATVSGRGVCIGASSNPALGGTCFSTSGTTGVFTVSATSLTQGTLYHYRAYATNSVGTSYTTDDTFTTLALNNYLVTVVSPQTAAVCATGTNSVTARDSTNTTITTDSSTVNMTNSGTSVTFYTTSGCTVSTTQYTLSSGVANIYYKTNVAQSFTITATKNGSTETGTSSSVTVNPGSQTRLVVTLPGQTFTATSGNSGSTTNQKVDSQFTITSLTATDDYFNVVTSYSGAKTLAYSGPTVTGGTFYTTSVNFTSGVSTTTLYTILTKAETKTITVTDGGQYGYASSNLTVTASSAPKLNIKGGVHF